MKDVRPTTFSEIIGQDAAKELLQLRAAACLKTKNPSSHFLLGGNAGLGKTTLARAYSNSIGSRFTTIMGTRINNWEDILAILNNIKPNDIIFIDEIHALKPRLQEELYQVLEDFKYEVDQWEYPMRKVKATVKLPQFTIIGATNHIGRLSPAFARRFPLKIELIPYASSELSLIIRKAAQRVYGMKDFPIIIADRLADLSQGNASKAVSFLKNLMEIAEATTTGRVIASDITSKLVIKLLKLNSIDPLVGLDRTSRQYLVALAESKRPIGIPSLTTILNEQEETIRLVVEPFLLNLNNEIIIQSQSGEIKLEGAFVQITRGREITETGKKYLSLCGQLQKEGGWFPGEKFFSNGDV